MTAEHHNALVKAFNQKYPAVRVEGFRSNSISVLNRVLNEARAGNHLVDVMNVNELNAWVLKDRRLLQVHKSRETEAFPNEFKDSEGFLPCCADVLTSDMAYNTRLVKKEEAPKSYQDLLLPVWKGKIGMEHDLAELFAALISIWGKDATVNYFKALVCSSCKKPARHWKLFKLTRWSPGPGACYLPGRRPIPMSRGYLSTMFFPRKASG